MFETLSGTSSCIACPACGKICIWNFPCICPMVRSLSNLSTPAKTSNLDADTDKNFELNPSNQLVQCGSDLQRSTLQVYVGVCTSFVVSSWVFLKSLTSEGSSCVGA